MTVAETGQTGNRKKRRTADMDSQTGTILSTLLKKRLKSLGYPSLRRFHADRPGLGLSYEVLRQVVYGGHIPRPETLFRILGSMQFSSSQVRKICGMHYGDYLPIPSAATDASLPSPAQSLAGTPESPADPGTPYPAERSRQENEPSSTPLEEPGEILSRLRASLQRVPVSGNEDFWEMVEALARIAEQKVRRSAGRQAEQPLLFAGEPEAIYQFLVRKNRIPPFLSRGENLTFDFVDGIDYRDRFRGALLGSAVGEALGAVTQGLTARDVQELFGELDSLPVFAAGRRAAAPHDSLLLSVAGTPRTESSTWKGRPTRRPRAPDDPPGLVARNLPARAPGTRPGKRPRRLPSSSSPALLRAGNFRRLKLEAGILASLTHTHPTAIAGAIAQACAVAKIVHTPASSLDVISFPRALSPVVAGIEPERGTRPRIGRSATTVGRKLGAELPALLLRRAPVQEMQETLGNGTAAHEGIPFSLGCFLRSPGDFAEAVVPAVRHGGDARAVAAMAGALCGAYLGESGIPERFLARLPGRRGLGEAAEGLLTLARGEG
jgi:ADP-ribosylglycohydrolase